MYCQYYFNMGAKGGQNRPRDLRKILDFVKKEGGGIII